MEKFFIALEAFAQTRSIWIYLVIFFGKMLEVATSTLRIVLINRGIRIIGSIIAVLEITLWLIITSTVLTSFRVDPLKMFVYALAFGIGNFVGSWLDEKLAFGLSSIQIVVPDIDTAQELCRVLGENGFGVSKMEVKGREEDPHYMIVTMIKRKLLKEGIALINKTCKNAVIMVSDVKVQKGGYLRNASARHIRSPLDG